MTNDEVYKFLSKDKNFKEAHSVMAEQRERLRDILDGFLEGNVNKIREQSGKLVKAVAEINRRYPQSEEKGPAAWQAMAKIVNESNAMNDDTLKNDYGKAYWHYSRVVDQCIQCHQAVRQWGKLPEPSPPPAKNAGA